MDDLVARLRAVIDETERIAQAVTDEHWREDVAEGGHWNEFDEQVSDYLLAHPPKVTLRRCAADRKILDLHQPGVTLTKVTDGATVTSCMSCGGWYTLKTGTEWPCDTVKALAEAYSIKA